MGHGVSHVHQILDNDGPRGNACLFGSSPFQLFLNIQGKQPSLTSSVKQSMVFTLLLSENFTSFDGKMTGNQSVNSVDISVRQEKQ